MFLPTTFMQEFTPVQYEPPPVLGENVGVSICYPEFQLLFQLFSFLANEPPMFHKCQQSPDASSDL